MELGVATIWCKKRIVKCRKTFSQQQTFSTVEENAFQMGEILDQPYLLYFPLSFNAPTYSSIFSPTKDSNYVTHLYPSSLVVRFL